MVAHGFSFQELCKSRGMRTSSIYVIFHTIPKLNPINFLTLVWNISITTTCLPLCKISLFKTLPCSLTVFACKGMFHRTDFLIKSNICHLITGAFALKAIFLCSNSAIASSLSSPIMYHLHQICITMTAEPPCLRLSLFLSFPRIDVNCSWLWKYNQRI